MNEFEPAYLALFRSGELKKQGLRAKRMLKKCTVCPRNCRVNRLAGETGECHIAYLPVVSSYFPHLGEERPISGSRGSGTIFLAGCNLGCLFCQNYELSHLLEGREISIQQFAEMMLELQTAGCHNINLVTPSHVVPQIIEALGVAAEKGLRIPLVYNSSGYDSLASLHLLNGIVDIYMPDFKFWDDPVAARYTRVADYGRVARQAIREMHRQVGDLRLDRDGIARRGLLIRHLVMPGLADQSRKIFQFIVREISPDSYVNVMNQYRPMGEAIRHPEINRRLRQQEYEHVLQEARDAGLRRIDGQM